MADIAAYLLQAGQRPPYGDTGDYCRARTKLNLTALQRLTCESAGQLEAGVPALWLWKGWRAKLVDGFTFGCQTILASWMLLSTHACRETGALYQMMLAHIAAHEVADCPRSH